MQPAVNSTDTMTSVHHYAPNKQLLRPTDRLPRPPFWCNSVWVAGCQYQHSLDLVPLPRQPVLDGLSRDPKSAPGSEAYRIAAVELVRMQ